MNKKLTILVSASLLSLVLIRSAFGAWSARRNLLQDGFVLRSIDGKVSSPDSNDRWFFELSSDISDGRAVLEAGTNLELLPSLTLERITADLRSRPSATYQLWGRATKYKGKNFIFPFYFLPLSKTIEPRPKTPQTPQKPQPQKDKPPEPSSTEKDTSQPTINEPNDALAIPQEIIEKLRARQIISVEQPGAETSQDAESIIQPPDVNQVSQASRQDSVLADRTALLVRQDDGRLVRQTYGGLVFILDALGRNVPKVSLRLLPCEALELTELRQSAQLEPLRFKIAGIMTKYKDQNYLLLQKATRVYSHGNFAR